MMGAIVSHSLIFSLLLRPAPTKTIKIPQTQTTLPEDDKTVCCQLTSLKEKTIHLLPKFFMFLGWIGIMGGHLFQIAITPIRAGYMGIADIRGAMLVSILGKVLIESFSKLCNRVKKCTHFQWQVYELISSVVLWNPTN